METLAMRTNAFLDAYYTYESRQYEYLRLINNIFADYLAAVHNAEPSLAFEALKTLHERRNDFTRSLFTFYGKDTLELAALHQSKKQEMANQPLNQQTFFALENTYLEMSFERRLMNAESLLFMESARNYLLLEIEEVGIERADQHFRNLPNGISYTKSILHSLPHIYEGKTDRIRLFDSLSYEGQLNSIRSLLAANELTDINTLWLDSFIKKGELFNFAVILPDKDWEDQPHHFEREDS